MEVEEQDVELAAVGGVHSSHNVDDDDDSGNKELVRNDVVPVGKMMGEMEDDQSEENNEDDDRLMITRSNVKSKSKMSDTDLCQYFNSKIRKKGEGNCGNRNCNCLEILTNGQVRLKVWRYFLSLFWWLPFKQDHDIIIFEWYKYSLFLKRTRHGSTRFHNY